MIETLIGLGFILSSYQNGADLSLGLGFCGDYCYMDDPVGIVRLATPLVENDLVRLELGGIHYSSIPNTADNYRADATFYYDTTTGQKRPTAPRLDIITLELTIKLRPK